MNQYNSFPQREKEVAVEENVVKELVADYLNKSGYSETLEAFKRESGVEVVPNRVDFSSLNELIGMFLRIIDTRCGRVKDGGDVHRIEAIIMKIVAEKQRCTQVISWNKSGMAYDMGKMEGVSGAAQSYRQPISIRRIISSPVSVGYCQDMDVCNRNVKTIRTLNIHKAAVSCMAIANRAQIMFSCSLDKKISIVDLTTYEFQIEEMSKSGKECKVSEINDEITIAIGFMDPELRIFKYTKKKKMQHVSGIKTLGATIVTFDFGVNNLFTVDSDGKLVIWSMNGKFLSMLQMTPDVTGLVCFTPSIIVINDSQKVVTINTITNEIDGVVLDAHATSVKRYEDKLLVVFQNYGCVFNNKFNKINTVNFGNNIRVSNLFANGNIIVGHENTVYIYGRSSTTVRLHSSSISVLETFTSGDTMCFVSAAADGEVKICEFEAFD